MHGGAAKAKVKVNVAQTADPAETFPWAASFLPPFRALFDRLRAAAIAPRSWDGSGDPANAPVDGSAPALARDMAWPLRGDFASGWDFAALALDRDFADAARAADYYAEAARATASGALAAWAKSGSRVPDDARAASASAYAAAKGGVRRVGSVAFAVAFGRARAAPEAELRVLDQTADPDCYIAARAAGAAAYSAPRGTDRAEGHALALESVAALASACDRAGAARCDTELDWTPNLPGEFDAAVAHSDGQVGNAVAALRAGGLLFITGARKRVATPASTEADGALAVANAPGPITTVFVFRKTEAATRGGDPDDDSKTEADAPLADPYVRRASDPRPPDAPLVDLPPASPAVVDALRNAPSGPDGAGDPLVGQTGDRVAAAENSPALDDELVAGLGLADALASDPAPDNDLALERELIDGAEDAPDAPGDATQAGAAVAAAIESAVAAAAAAPAVKRFAILSGETSPGERAAILAIERDPRNARGELLAALLISKTGAEGLDLKVGRVAIHLEPFWDEARHAQVDARIVRVGSHDALPRADRDVRSVMLVATANEAVRQKIPPEHREAATTDEVFRERARTKGRLVGATLAMLRGVAIECAALGYDAAGVCSACRTCVPTGARLFRGDAATDARAPDPCRSRGAPAAVTARPVTVGAELFHWRADPAAPTGVAVFAFRADVGAHVAVAPNDPRMTAILDAIDKQKMHN